jgi:tRNA C32,U32 (ribose-2'-O)-methylase TrmJ
LEQAAIEADFYKPASGSKLPTRLRRLFSRVPNLEREEVNILRGLLNALQKARSK